MTFDYEGIKIYYEIEGEGPDLLLLHGWGCSHEIFRAFIGQWAVNHRVISLDFPGFGQSNEPTGVWGVSEYTAMTEALCSHLGVVKPSIVCHSFGGRVAIMFASRNETGRMIFADAAGIKPHRSLKYKIKVGTYKITKWYLLKVLRRKDLYDKYREGKGSADYKNASDTMKAVLSKCVNQDLSALLPRIQAPVLLFWGENDTATPLKDAKLMEKRIPDAGLVIVKGGSHFSFIDDPGLFSAVSQSFLK